MPYKGYVRKRPKHEPNDSHFYLAIELSKCMVRADVFNFHVDYVRTETTDTQKIPIYKVCSSDERESKGILTDENLPQVYYTDESKSESFIVNESSTEDR